MHGKVFLLLLPFLIWFAGAVVVSCLFVYLVKSRRWTGRSLFIRHLLPGPGGVLRQQLSRVSDKLDYYLFLFAFLFPLLVVLLVARRILCPAPLYPLSLPSVTFYLIVFGGLAFLLGRVLRLLAEQRNLSFSLECELAVGQELNLLMRQGCSVFHDVPDDGDKIDHVLVGPSGIYAVATKWRANPGKKRLEVEDRVFYDGKVLVFPDGEETGPVVQVRRQAVWLADWLSGVVGEKVSVKAIVFLPGWVVESSGRSEVSVVNEKSAPLLGKPRGGDVLAEDLRQRIACQVEQRCRIMAGGHG